MWRYLGMVLLALPGLVGAAYNGSGWRVGVIDAGIYKHQETNNDQGDPLLVSRLVNEHCYSIPNSYTTSVGFDGTLWYEYKTSSTCRNGQITDNTALTPNKIIVMKRPSGLEGFLYQGDKHGSIVGHVIATTSTGAKIQPVNAISAYRAASTTLYYSEYHFRKDDVKNALKWMYNNRSKLASVNLSLGFKDSSLCRSRALETEVNRLVNAGSRN